MPARVPRVTKTLAIVLRHRRLGDADRIVTLLTPGRGKLDVVAKGALRTRSRLGGHLEPLSHSEIVLAHGRNLDIVTQAQVVEPFLAIRGDLERLGMAMYLLELADLLSYEDIDASDVYGLLLAALTRLERGDGMQLTVRVFELSLLEVAGFRPEWGVCTVCGTEVMSDEAAWTPGGGGVICVTCRAGHEDARPLDATTLRVLRAYQSSPYEEAARIRLSPELAARLENVMHELMRSTVERELKSADFSALARRVSAMSGVANGGQAGSAGEEPPPDRTASTPQQL